MLLFINVDPFRSEWHRAHNFEEAKRPAGGWSAHGQPVDQLHHQYRDKIRQLDLAACSMKPNLRERLAYEDMPLRASGEVVLKN